MNQAASRQQLTTAVEENTIAQGGTTVRAVVLSVRHHEEHVLDRWVQRRIAEYINGLPYHCAQISPALRRGNSL